MEELKQTSIVDTVEVEKYLDKFQKQLIEVSIDKIVPNEWNPNRHDEQSFQTIINSIRKFGFNDPVSVRQIIKEVDEYEIIDGEHRWKAAKTLGFTKILVINFGEVSREEAMTLTQLLNHKGRNDILLKAKMLRELKNQVSLFELLPGSDKDKEETMKLLDFDFSVFESKGDEEEIAKKDDYQQAVKKATELEIILRRIHEESKNENLRMSIEQFYAFVRMLKSYLV